VSFEALAKQDVDKTSGRESLWPNRILPQKITKHSKNYSLIQHAGISGLFLCDLCDLSWQKSGWLGSQSFSLCPSAEILRCALDDSTGLWHPASGLPPTRYLFSLQPSVFSLYAGAA
jgi:hypothetical protein